MRAAYTRNRQRASFTLIELLVVIAIIGVLISLLLAAVFKVLSKADETRNRNDITQLANGVLNFQAKFAVPYIPSRIFLAKNLSDYQPLNSFHQDSLQYLNRVWPKLNWTDSTNGRIPIAATGWGGKDQQILEGEECLVFFLGGIPSGGGVVGFSTNPTNPVIPGGARITCFDFQASRLKDIRNTGYPSYLDVYGKKPYAYFSSYKTTNGYNRYGLGVDCSTLGVAPYAETWSATPQYVKPDGFQIISAGQDGTFGKGTVDAGTTYRPGATNLPINNPGYDDMANFYDRFLGIAAN
jgi:prepilin-type N-terminal cleavage/methylation domain-containing protein